MEAYKVICSEPVMEHNVTEDQESATTAEISGWIERASLLINLPALGLSFALLIMFWLGNISPPLLAVVGLPVLMLLSYFFVYKSRLLQKPSRITPRAWICIGVLGIVLFGGFYLRYPTNAHIHGGQDHGSYFNIAAWIAKHGTYNRHDQILEVGTGGNEHHVPETGCVEARLNGRVVTGNMDDLCCFGGREGKNEE